jgi:hypothetical protein
MKNSQSGLGHIVVIALIFLVVGVIGFIGWKVYDIQHPEPKTDPVILKETKSPPTPKEEKVTWVTYKNEEAGLTFDYPDNWKHEVGETGRGDDGDFWGVSGTVTSPRGNELTWIYMLAGGSGGGCEPDPGDIAFEPGNKCSSKKILSVEKAQVVKMNPASTHRNMFDDQLIITRTKYLSSQPGSDITYHICLDPYYTSDIEANTERAPKVGTSMGLLFPCAFWKTGFNVRFDVKTESDFNSTDAKTAEKIMKTFDSL